MSAKPKEPGLSSPVPEGWTVKPLETLLREPLRNGHSAKATEDPNGIRTLTLTAVTRKSFVPENTKITCADPHRVREMWLEPSDILIERANTPEYVGLAAIYEGSAEMGNIPRPDDSSARR